MPDDPTTDPNASSWAPGAPAPWLSPFGPSPDAGAVAPATVAPLADPSSAMPQPGPLDLSLPPGAVPPPNGVNLAAPQSMPGGGPPDLTLPPIGAPPSGPPGAQFTPPWLAAQAGPLPGAPGSPSLAPATDAAPSPPNSLGGVDAVSGGAAPAEALTPDQTQSRFGTIATDPNASLAERTKAWAAMTPDQKTEALNSTDPKQLAALANDAMSPQELATIAIRHNAAKQDEETQKQLAIYKDNQAKADQEVADTKFAVAHADQESAKDAAAAQALVAQSKNIGKTGIGSLIGGGIAALVGGMFAHQMGGRNLGLEGFQKGIEQKIQAQTEELNAGWKAIDIHKNAVAQEFQRHGDLIRAQGVARLAAFQGAKDQLTAEMQNYDPKGTTAIQRATAIQGINAAQAQQAQALRQQNLKNGLDLAKAQSDTAKQLEETRHNKATEGIDWFKANIEKTKANAALGADAPIPIAQLAAQNPGAPVPPASAFAGGVMQPSQYTKWLADQKTSGEISGTTVKNAQSTAAGQVLSPASGKPYVGDDGKPVQIEPTVAAKLNERSAGAQQYLDAMSAVERELAADPSTIDRNKWAQINSNLETAKASWTQMYGAKASSREMEAASDVVGANFDGYVNRVKDKGTAIASIGTQIESTKQNMNTSLKGIAGIRSKADLVDASTPPPTKTTEADKADATLGMNYLSPKVDPNTLAKADRDFVNVSKEVGTNPAAVSEYVRDNPDTDPETVRGLHAGVAPSQLKVFDSYSAAIDGSNDAARTDAISRLDAIAKGGSTSPSVRAYALALINQASQNVAASATGAPEDLEPEVR